MWQPNTAYSLGDVVKVSDNPNTIQYIRARNNGTSGPSVSRNLYGKLSDSYSRSITSVGTTATVTEPFHGRENGSSVTISGATESPYNGTFTVNVIDQHTWSYTLLSTTTSPATGSPVAGGPPDYVNNPTSRKNDNDIVWEVYTPGPQGPGVDGGVTWIQYAGTTDYTLTVPGKLSIRVQGDAFIPVWYPELWSPLGLWHGSYKDQYIPGYSAILPDHVQNAGMGHMCVIPVSTGGDHNFVSTITKLS
jgi:hypothetical protein